MRLRARDEGDVGGDCDDNERLDEVEAEDAKRESDMEDEDALCHRFSTGEVTSSAIDGNNRCCWIRHSLHVPTS